MSDLLDHKQGAAVSSEQQPAGNFHAGDPQEEVVLSAKDAWKMLSPEHRRLIKICAVLGIITIFVLPAVTVCLAVWKYKQERMVQIYTDQNR